MARHAVSFVKWETFRPSGGNGGVAVYDYGSAFKNLVDRVGDGGTLWLITSRQKGPSKSYHLAYKLVDCTEIEPGSSIFSGKWPYVVRARDRQRSRHFGRNDLSPIIRRLQFTEGLPMSETRNVGTRLLSVPELTRGDVELLELFQHQHENDRAAFVSYAHADLHLVELIEDTLVQKGVSIARDVVFLHAGEEWEPALRREVTGTDCFFVVVTESAANSSWVRKEVRWAIDEYEAGGIVKLIVPIVAEGAAFERFPELARFQRFDFPAKAEEGAWDRLAADVVSARNRT